MKNFILIFFVLFSFIGCNNPPYPNIKLKNADGKIVGPVTQYDGWHKYDTVITLFSQYDDPGVFVEGKKVVVTSNIADVIAKYEENGHYVKKAGLIEIKYTARDEDGHEAHISRYVRIANPSEIVAPYNPTTESPYGSTTFKLVSRENVDGTSNQLWDESLKNQTVTFTCDQNIPGAIRINKAFIHKKDKSSNEIISFGGLVVELYSESSELSQDHSNVIGYLGTKKNIDLPFYDKLRLQDASHDVTFYEVLNMLNNPSSSRHIQYLKVKENHEITYNGEKIVNIKGISNKNCILEYAGTEIIGITLNYFVSYPGSIDENPSSMRTFEVTEVYEKQYFDE